MQRMLNVIGLQFENIQTEKAPHLVLLYFWTDVAEYAPDKFAICGFFFKLWLIRLCKRLNVSMTTP